jgi:hypothetical protein
MPVVDVTLPVDAFVIFIFGIIKNKIWAVIGRYKGLKQVPN